MAVEPSSSSSPAPFLQKTYEMIDDATTDSIVSWSANNNSFVVWNPPEFARILLPKYFKHSNFSSFIRQLNTYGFRKIDSEKWEFANEDFVKDQKHLLKNIHRRKPIHSHSHPPGSVADPERMALEEEIERLQRDKARAEASLLILEQNSDESGDKLQMDDLMRRTSSLKKRQGNLLSILEKNMPDPNFRKHLQEQIQIMNESSYKKRRLPQVNHSQSLGSSFVDDQSSNRPEFSNIIQQDCSHRIRLELSPAVSDVNMISHSTESSNEGGSPRRRILEPKDTQVRTEGLLFTPEAISLSGTDTAFSFKMNTSEFEKVTRDENSKLHSPQHGFIAKEDGDGLVPCHLNLSLASSPLQANKYSYSARGQQEDINFVKSLDLGVKSDAGEFQQETDHADGNGSFQEVPKQNQGLPTAPSRVNDVFSEQYSTGNNSDAGDFQQKTNHADGDPSLQEVPKPNQNPPAPARVNDIFWEQFLTERPGSSDNEEASSNYRANSCDEHEDKGSSQGMSKNAENMKQLTL